MYNILQIVLQNYHFSLSTVVIFNCRKILILKITCQHEFLEKKTSQEKLYIIFSKSYNKSDHLILSKHEGHHYARTICF